MKTGRSSTRLAAGAIAILGVLSAPVASAEPEEGTSGFWRESHPGFEYIVDSLAQLCFAATVPPPATGAIRLGGAGLARIPCENLARRKAWRPILTWIEPPPDSSETKAP